MCQKLRYCEVIQGILVNDTPVVAGSSNEGVKRLTTHLRDGLTAKGSSIMDSNRLER